MGLSPVAVPAQREQPGLALLWVLAAGAVAASVGVVVLARGSREINDGWLAAGFSALLIDWVALMFVIAGLVAWRRRPDIRMGPLMVSVGFCFYVWTLQLATAALPFTIGVLVDYLVVALFLHIYLSYPTGRLREQPERGLVLTGYGTCLGLQIVKVLLGGEPSTLLTLVEQPVIAASILTLQIWSIVALCLAAMVVLVMRRLERGVQLRPAIVLSDLFSVSLLLMALFFTASMLHWPAFWLIQLATFVVVGLAPVAFLAGLLDARLARGRVGALVVALRASPFADLREPLATALRDPSLSVAYWLSEFACWSDRDGQPVPDPGQTPDRGSALIERDGQPVAALLFAPHLLEEPELVAGVTAAAGMALENDRLKVELRARVQELRDSRIRMLDASQAERQRLERNLHDGAQQRLVALSLELGMLEYELRADAAARLRLKRARAEIAVSLEELRDVARGIYPAVLNAHGLAVALESLAVRSPVPLTLNVETGDRLPVAVEAAAYYVICESLANIGKHAQATAAGIDVRRAGGQVAVEIVDNGVGGADPERGTGLRGLADRVEALGGQLRIWTPVDEGTRVQVEMPCG
jgi:signal transduction histidine kinase